MATVFISLATVQGRALTGATLPIPDSQPVANPEAFTSSGVNQTTTMAAGAAGQVWCVFVSGGDVALAMGAAPNAVSGPKWKVPEGLHHFAASVAGEKLALADA